MLYADITDDLDILVDSEFELDVTFSSGVNQPIAGYHNFLFPMSFFSVQRP